VSLLAGVPKDAHVLVFRDAEIARALSEQGYRHVYCLTDDDDQPRQTQIKYYPYSLDTHFPDDMFEVVINPSLMNEERARFLEESHRVGAPLAVILAPLSGKEMEATVVEKETRKVRPKGVNIVCNSLGKAEGIEEYSKNLKMRFEELGLEVRLVRKLREADPRYPTIFEFEPGIATETPSDPSFIVEAHFTNHALLLTKAARQARLAFEADGARYLPALARRHAKQFALNPGYYIELLKRNDPKINRKLEKCKLLVRHPDLARKSGIERYTLMPHIAYPEMDFNRKDRKSNQIRLGSFGFAVESKNFERICDLAIRLGVDLTLVLSLSRISRSVNLKQRDYARWLTARYRPQGNIRIMTGYFTQEEVLHELSDCTHIISAQDDAVGVSGSMRFVMRLGVPIVSVDNFQAREAQVYIRDLNEITREYLEKTREPTSLDDGFFYLRKVLNL